MFGLKLVRSILKWSLRNCIIIPVPRLGMVNTIKAKNTNDCAQRLSCDSCSPATPKIVINKCGTKLAQLYDCA